MSDSQTLRNELMVRLDIQVKDRGIESLSEDQLTFWAASYSLGIIRNEGLHGFLFWLSNYLTREMSVAAFFDLGVEKVAFIIINAGDLLLEYLEDKSDDEISSDAFRSAFEKELDEFEEQMTPLKTVVEDHLVVLAMKINSANNNNSGNQQQA